MVVQSLARGDRDGRPEVDVGSGMNSQKWVVQEARQGWVPVLGRLAGPRFRPRGVARCNSTRRDGYEL